MDPNEPPGYLLRDPGGPGERYNYPEIQEEHLEDMQTARNNKIWAKRTSKNKKIGAHPDMHDDDADASNKDEDDKNRIQTNNRYNYLETQEEHVEDKQTKRKKQIGPKGPRTRKIAPTPV